MNVRMLRRVSRAACFSLALLGTAGAGDAPARVAVIYGTDLYHPHVDADDHFDLATIASMDDIDLKAIVLDNAGPSQADRPGSIPVRQVLALARRSIPFAAGLRARLKGPEDKGLDQEARWQGGVELILSVLRAATARVDIVMVGSMRDLAAALNRDPALFAEKAGKLLLFISDADAAHSSEEYNVGLDPAAFARVMRSGLDVRWVPCFDGGAPKNIRCGSEWVARRADLLAGCSPRVLQYFIYGLKRKSGDPIAFLDAPVDPEEKKWLLSDSKELFCTAIFTCLAGRRTVQQGARCVALPPARAAGLPERKVFGFSPVDVIVSNDGRVRYEAGPGSRRVLRFEILDRERYGEAMTQMTAALLEGLGR